MDDNTMSTRDMKHIGSYFGAMYYQDKDGQLYCQDWKWGGYEEYVLHMNPIQCWELPQRVVQEMKEAERM